jgi:very-short-patch-repair endonuclease
VPRWQLIPQENWSRARELRRQLTPAELLLWRALKEQSLSVRVRRQQPIGPYIVDFLFSKCKLVVELDGPIHTSAEQRQHDAARDEYFAQRGYEVVRFANRDVLEHIDRVVEEILQMLPPLSPR